MIIRWLPLRKAKAILTFLQSHLKDILIVFLLGCIAYLYLSLDTKEKILLSKLKERDLVRNKLEFLKDEVENLNLVKNQSENQHAIYGVGLSKMSSELETLNLLLGGAGATRQPVVKDQRTLEVCPEQYKGNSHFPYFLASWENVKCDYGKKIEELVTVYLDVTEKNLIEAVESLRSIHPKIRILSTANPHVDGSGVEQVPFDMPLKKLRSMIKTKYVLMGSDLHYFTEWSNLHRSVRLLSESKLRLMAVGGAVRNETGHWQTGCYQLHSQYYRLQIDEGYRNEHEDCMICDFVGGPVLMRTETVGQGIDLPVRELDSWLVDLALQKNGLWLACPDVMYFSRSRLAEFPHLARNQWQSLAAAHYFQGVSFGKPFHYHTEFDCDEVGLECNARQQTASFLAPWCCIKAFRTILRALEKASALYPINYELEAGSTLGAVKLGNFIPWDIDMDIGFATESFSFFKPGGEAAKILEDAGISLYRYSEDCYDLKGAGFFLMDFGGVTVEMLGRKTNLSKSSLPASMQQYSTRIYVGDGLWVPTVGNPGAYARGRYGPGYLYHVQSWRYKEGMIGSGDTYRPGAWQPCTAPGHPACLDSYPIVGNMLVRADMYP